MKDIRQNRFLVWIMWLAPIAMTGWWSVFVWTAIQIVLCDKQEKRRVEHVKQNEEKLTKEKELKEREIQRKIALAEEWGKHYVVINGEVKMFDRK